MKILLVEDELLIANDIKSQLESLGYVDIHLAHNSKDALVAFEEIIPDFIIMDIGLKGSKEDGIALAERLSEDRIFPLIFLSSYSDQQTLDRTKNVPNSTYLVKPCSARQLFVSIDLALENFIPEELPIDQEKPNSDYQSPRCPLFAVEDHFFMKGSRNSYTKVIVRDIQWVESVRGGIEINYADNQKLMLTASLNSFIQQFSHPDLIRIHRSYIINKRKVVNIKEKSFEIQLNKKCKTLPCSSTYWKTLNQTFLKLKSD
jgi:DNA-binding LytR/AlgR family response regulator